MRTSYHALALKFFGLVALLFAGFSLAGDTATAQQPPDDGNEITTGTAGGTATNASVFNIADLKSDDGTGCTSVGTLDANDYDDDPGGTHPRPDLFHVAPNLGDTPLQCANKYVFINNPSSVLQVQKTIYALIPGETGGSDTTRVVFNDERPGSDIRTGQACLDMLGSSTTGPSVAHGLITTGQKTATEITDIKNGCTQSIVGVLANPFPVSKHLPPGWYQQCAVLATSGGGATSPFCTYFHVEPVTGFTEDVTTIDYGVLTQNVTSIDGGDFIIGTPGTPDIGTVMGLGNTSPILQVAYSEMENDFGTTAEEDNKFITRDFDVQINRRDSAGAIIAFQKVANMLGGTDPDAADPFLGATVATLNQICLEPNEPLKIDFSVTPRDVLYPGTYTGLARMTITTAGACTPTLGDAENASGDGDGDPFNNQAGAVPVSQTAP